MPIGVLEAAAAAAPAAAAGTKGDKGRLLGAAGDGGLFLGFGVLRRREETQVEVKQEQEREERQSEGMRFHSSGGKGNEVPSAAQKTTN